MRSETIWPIVVHWASSVGVPTGVAASPRHHAMAAFASSMSETSSPGLDHGSTCEAATPTPNATSTAVAAARKEIRRRTSPPIDCGEAPRAPDVHGDGSRRDSAVW